MQSFRKISMIIMVILDQNELIWIIFKIKKSKIHKNGNKTSIQPILKSISTSFMLNNYFCEINIKKVTHGVGASVKWWNLPNFLGEV